METIGVKDSVARENFERLNESFLGDPLLKSNFKFFEVTFEAESYPKTVGFKHGLGFVPKDVITTNSLPGTPNWKYDQFTRTHIYAEVWVPTTIRFFLGTYAEDRTS